MQRVILKLSGEALANQNGDIISAQKVLEVAQEIKELKEQGVELGIVIGAGNIWRGRDVKEFGMERASADYMGMLATVLNCLALHEMLKQQGIKSVVLTAHEMNSFAECYTRRKALQYFDEKYVVIFAGGTGSPFFSTDSCAALRAGEVNAKTILMAKNGVDGVYDADPRVCKDAKRFQTLTYDEILKKHLNVMDLTAATLCAENDIKMVVFDMSVKGNIKKVITKPEIGTIITK